MKTFGLWAVIAALVMSPLPTAAEFAELDVSPNVSSTTDYVWRGFSQTNEDPAMQGGLDLSHESGVYVGTWGSNVEFGSAAHVEMDMYGGLSGELANGIGWDVGVIHYAYPSESEIDFNEYYFSPSWNMLSAQVAWSDDFAGSGETALYLSGGVEYEIPDALTLSASVGQSRFEESSGNYLDYRIGASRELLPGAGLAVAFTGTDLDGVDLASERATLTLWWSQ